MANILPATTIAAAIVTPLTSSVLQVRRPPKNVNLEAVFLYGAGGTTVDAYVQTSVDGGGSWVDIANFHFTTAAATKMFNLSALTPVTTSYAPTDGTLTNDTCKDGILGTQFRVKYKSSGTYSGATSLTIYIGGTGLTT